MAFKSSDPVELIVKSINAQFYPQELEELIQLASGYKNIIFRDGYLSAFEHSSLLQVADVFVSLHRAEGYGINIVDALASKTAVISTAYSGNMDFLKPSHASLIQYDFVKVGSYAGQIVEGSWANRDVEHAAFEMKKLSKDFRRVEFLANAGQQFVRDNLNVASCSNILFSQVDL